MTGDHSIQLTSEHLRVRILPRGATLSEVRFSSGGPNLVLGFEDAQNYADIPIYAGALVGPVANRIAGGLIQLEGETYQMPLNEKGRTCLHSGPGGLHALEWDVESRKPDQVTLSTTLKNGDHGLPGKRRITAHYQVQGSMLKLSISAQSDQPTPMNIAAHPYWNLDGAGDVKQHQLQVAAPHYLPVNRDNLPTGEIAAVDATPFDFRTARPVPLSFDLDVNFCLADAARANPAPCATLKGGSGTTLKIATTAPGLQVYNGAYLPEVKGVLSNGRDLSPFAGIALEPQCWPDAPHHETFPQITVHPGEVWRQITTYDLVAGQIASILP